MRALSRRNGEDSDRQRNKDLGLMKTKVHLRFKMPCVKHYRTIKHQ